MPECLLESSLNLRGIGLESPKAPKAQRWAQYIGVAREPSLQQPLALEQLAATSGAPEVSLRLKALNHLSRRCLSNAGILRKRADGSVRQLGTRQQRKQNLIARRPKRCAREIARWSTSALDAREIARPERQEAVSGPVDVIDSALLEVLTESRCHVGRHQNRRLPLRAAHLRRHVTGELIAKMHPLDLRVQPPNAPWSLDLDHGVKAPVGLARAQDSGIRSPNEGKSSEVV
jgi:hypothetical protein